MVHADCRMASRQERVVREDDVAILAPNHCFVTEKVVDVPSYALGGVLNQARKASCFGGAEYQNTALPGRAEGQLTVSEHLEAQHLLPDQDHVSVAELGLFA
jgi:hypothetical protein